MKMMSGANVRNKNLSQLRIEESLRSDCEITKPPLIQCNKPGGRNDNIEGR